MVKYKQKRKLGKAICNNCGIEFEKPNSELKRNAEIGRNNYCSRSCCGKKIGSHANSCIKNRYPIKKHGKVSDEYTGIRDFLRRARNRYKEVTVSLEYLKELWDAQKHKCVYSKLELHLPFKSTGINDPIFTASLDRIDSSKGYIEGNVQWVSQAINYMKGQMSHEQTLELIQLIKDS